MNVKWLVVACLIPALAVGEEPRRRQAELKWAREVAEDFLDAYLHGQTQHAEQLLAPGYAKLDRATLDAILLNGFNSGYRNAKIVTEQMAPRRDEAVFRGELRSEAGIVQPGADFTVRVVKDDETGKWRVAFFRHTDRPPAK